MIRTVSGIVLLIPASDGLYSYMGRNQKWYA